MSMPFIAIKCVDEMCTLDSALVQCALLHRAIGGGGGGAEGYQSHFGRSVNPISIREKHIMPTTLLLHSRIIRPSYGPAT